jgi:Kef-type K+ transport system membrane component KefB
MLIGHPVFWILGVAVVAPLLAEIPNPFKVPVVVLEVLLGIVIGPHALHLVDFDGFVATMFDFGMAASLFMGGLDLDFADIKGRPMLLAVGGWTISVLLSVTIVSLLHAIPHVRTPFVVAMALCTTGLGVVAPGFRDSGLLATAFGRFVLAAGTLGEVGPIVAMSLLLSEQYSFWQESALLGIFLVIIAAALAIGIGARPPKVLEILRRHMNKSTQLPVRISVFVLAGLLFLAQKFGFESFTGAFAAGTILGASTRSERGSVLRDKMETLSFGWFYPFFSWAPESSSISGRSHTTCLRCFLCRRSLSCSSSFEGYPQSFIAVVWTLRICCLWRSLRQCRRLPSLWLLPRLE